MRIESQVREAAYDLYLPFNWSENLHPQRHYLSFCGDALKDRSLCSGDERMWVFVVVQMRSCFLASCQLHGAALCSSKLPAFSCGPLYLQSSNCAWGPSHPFYSLTCLSATSQRQLSAFKAHMIRSGPLR